MILVQVQKEVGPLIVIVHSRRIAHLPLKNLFLGPHFLRLMIPQETALSREITFLTIFLGMIHLLHMIVALRTSLDLTP